MVISKDSQLGLRFLGNSTCVKALEILSAKMRDKTSIKNKGIIKLEF